MLVDFLRPAENQQKADEVEAKINKAADACKVFNRFHLGHHLGNTKKDTDPGQDQ